MTVGHETNAGMENIMSKKPEKATLTSAMIEAQTAAFLKSGGSVEYISKGKSGQYGQTASAPGGMKK